MEKGFEVMVNASDLIELGFRPYQAKQMVKECKEHLAKVEGIDLYYNRQINIVPARTLEKLFGIQIRE